MVGGAVPRADVVMEAGGILRVILTARSVDRKMLRTEYFGTYFSYMSRSIMINHDPLNFIE